jgi:hypothetical protein
MKPSAKLTRLALIFLAAPLLASCQSVSKTSSSTIERTADEIETEVTNRICTALTPERIPRADYDASPESVRTALSRNGAAWVMTCPPQR